MFTKHYKNILLANDIVPNSKHEESIALKLVAQKEKFILEDAVKALLYNKTIIAVDNKYSLTQFIHEVNSLTQQYYFMYIQISQFESFLRTYINHKMVKVYGDKWHQNNIMKDLREFNFKTLLQLDKPSKALNSISFLEH